MEEKKRYYLHGDYKEDDNTKIYCKPCDLFVNEDHMINNDYNDVDLNTNHTHDVWYGRKSIGYTEECFRFQEKLYYTKVKGKKVFATHTRKYAPHPFYRDIDVGNWFKNRKDK